MVLVLRGRKSKVYSKREKEKEKDKPPSQASSQEASLNPSPEVGIVFSSSVSPSFPSFDDVDVLIVICKGVRSCTQHPIFNFVSLSHLSFSFRSFSLGLSSVFISRNELDALSESR